MRAHLILRALVKRALFFVLALLLGLTLLFRGLIGFGDYLAWLSAGSPSGEPEPVKTPPPKPSPTPLPDPSATELDRLMNGPPDDQRVAIRTMAERRPTPELSAAIDQTLFRSSNTDVLAALTCLKVTAFPADALSYAFSKLPTDKKAYAWHMDDGAMCLLRAVADHAAEDPVRARELLLLGHCSDNGTVRGIVHAGFEHIDLPDMPSLLQVEAQSSWGSQRSCAIASALALNALEHAPAMVERALFDEDGGGRVVRYHLLRSKRAAAPRLLARMLVTQGEREPLAGIATEREQTKHDVTSALVEMAFDEQVPSEMRARALEVIGRRGDVGAMTHLFPLRNRPDPVLQPAAVAAIMALEARRNAGATAMMKPLAP
jgi:hypothetical protein